ncbi:hypothetical protein J6X96_02305 [bacterium]|nr:hypothetical protein [bacterium]
MKRFLCLVITLALAFSVWAAAPENDNFADCGILTIGTDVFGTNTEATLEVGEAEHLGQSWEHSVWYKFNLGTPYKQLVTISVHNDNSGLDPCLVIAAGSSVKDLRYIVVQDTNIDETYSGTFKGDVDYYVGVYSYTAEAHGAFRIESLNSPLNDWYCSPDGKGSGRTADDPCTLNIALESAGSGSAVYMAPGTYKLSKVGAMQNLRWTDGNFLLVNTADVSVIGAGSDQTVILCDEPDDIGVYLTGTGVTLKGVSIRHPKDVKGNTDWGGSYYGLTAPLTVADADSVTLEDVYVIVGSEGETEDPDSGALIRPASLQLNPGGSLKAIDCAFVSDGLLTSCLIKPFTWDPDADADKKTRMDFSFCTFKSNRDVIAGKKGDDALDHQTALYGNTWYGSVPFTVNVDSCVFLNTLIPVSEQGGGSDKQWVFNVRDCFMPGAKFENSSRAVVTYTNCDNVFDPLVDEECRHAAVKAGKDTVVPIEPFVTVLEEDFSGYESGSIKGKYGWGDGYGSDGSITAVKEDGNTYVEIHPNSLWGAHYDFENPVSTGWGGGASNRYRIWRYSARMKMPATEGYHNFGFWSPTCAEVQFRMVGDHYQLRATDAHQDSQLDIPADEWFDLTLDYYANFTDGRHWLKSVTVNGVTEEINEATMQENASDIFSTLRFFFFAGGVTLSLDRIKLEYCLDGPLNDHLSRPFVYEKNTNVTGDNTFAKIEPGEDTMSRATVWYRLKGEKSETIELSTAGSFGFYGNDTTLSIYSSSSDSADFSDLAVVVPLTDAGKDETVSFTTAAGKYYYIAVGSGSGGGKFLLRSGWAGNIYVAPGGTGDGRSPETPTNDLAAALDSVEAPFEVVLAPGTYSIADYHNKYDCWGVGNTVLCLKTAGTGLRGAGPGSTTILAPEGYTGFRLEQSNCTLADLTIKSVGTSFNPAAGNRDIFQGALCLCDAEGAFVTNVAVISEQNANGVRPFTMYNVKDSTVCRLAVSAPNHTAPTVMLGCQDDVLKNLTVCGKEGGQCAVYQSKQRLGASKGISCVNCLFYRANRPFFLEDNVEVFASNCVYYAATKESYVGSGAKLSEEKCVSLEEGVNDPNFKEAAGHILCATKIFYANIGWFTMASMENDDLFDAITVLPGETRGDNTGATVEAGENESHKASVWYRFVPTEDGVYKIDDLGSFEASGFDAMLSVYALEGEEVSFSTLAAVVESQNAGLDERCDLTARAGTVYYICWDGFEGSQGAFSMRIEKKHDGSWFIAPGASGSGRSADDPSGDLVKALEEVVSGQTVNLAPGDYSLARYHNQYDIWGEGMTALCFMVDNVTLKGAGPDKTAIIIPEGYVGVRMERDGAALEDLLIMQGGRPLPNYRYNWHMQGALCACNKSGMSIRNVAVYSLQGTGEPYTRPFSVYSVTDFSAQNVCVLAPNCANPVFLNQVSDCALDYLTVDCAALGGQPAVYVGNWPWGASSNLSFASVLIADAYMPFKVEAENDVVIEDSLFYGCVAESAFDAAADVLETNCLYYAAGTEDPDFQDVDGYMLTPVNPVYDRVGWRAVPEPSALFLLALFFVLSRAKSHVPLANRLR